ncbi:MAG: glycosyltransferase [Acetobacteraceae bacterium]|nr:glycosyltransferase [Acetobacteraceae bacterium]
MTADVLEAEAVAWDAPAREPWHGLLDYYGYHAPSGAWCFVGWVEQRHIAPDKPTTADLRIDFESGTLSGPGIVTYFYRPDLGERGSGMVVHFPSSGRGMGRPVWLELCSADRTAGLTVPSGCQHLRGADLGARLFAELSNAEDASESRTTLLGLLLRKGFTGEDTLGALKDEVRLELDAVIACRPEGVVLMGWMAAAPEVVRAIRLRAGLAAAPVTERNTLRVPRPDVLEALGPDRAEPDCGFMAYCALPASGAEPMHLEIETARGEVGYKPVPAPRGGGIEAIKRVLSAFDLRYDQLAPAFDGVAGPAVRALNAERLRQRPRVGVVTLGRPHPAPRHSVIVPLYGRIDFLEYQAALFARHGLPDAELIYVLDDPPRRRELEALAASVHERFQVPLRLLMLDRNMGFAPANNVALARARGEFVCFMNSDVFPGAPGWLAALSRRLEDDPGLGAVGPLLLFENGSVQHQGMDFERLEEFGGWMFPTHPRKGLKPPAGAALLHSPAITAACLVMRRALADELGGFDEAYVIGDFEDSDLCLRVGQLGLACAVDPSVRLYHLERRSQVGAAQRWRMNMTLYNAWTHQGRWIGGARG